MAVDKLWVALLLMVGMILVVPDKQHVLAQQCQGDIQGLIKECAQYVQTSGESAEPSVGCCNILKKVDVPCACKQVTEEVEKIISMQKVVYVLKTCGQPLRHGTKCGGYTAPLVSPVNVNSGEYPFGKNKRIPMLSFCITVISLFCSFF